METKIEVLEKAIAKLEAKGIKEAAFEVKSDGIYINFVGGQIKLYYSAQKPDEFIERSAL